jgi:hypothetical protein
LVNKKPKIVCLFLDISLCVSFLFVWTKESQTF